VTRGPYKITYDTTTGLLTPGKFTPLSTSVPASQDFAMGTVAS
jgi:hypothetical protein